MPTLQQFNQSEERKMNKTLKRTVVKKTVKKDFIFVCNKCGHNLYTSVGNIKILLKTECPSCGEEAFELWTLSGMGIYK